MARTQGSHAGITGPRIRDAALRLFAEHGFAAVSMRQIASAVGLQAGALYNYTPDKQTLLFSLLKGHMDELLSAWEAEANAGSPLARLERFTRFHIRFNVSRPEAIFISYMELRNLEPENFSAIETLRRRYETELETLAAWMEQPDTRNVVLDRNAVDLGFAWFQEPNGKIWWTMVTGNGIAADALILAAVEETTAQDDLTETDQ